MATYRSVPPIGQLHENSCWAACLAWWLKAVGGRPSWTQAEIIDIYRRSTDSSGAIVPSYMLNAFSRDTRIKMQAKAFETSDPLLEGLPLGEKPVLIAFKHMTGFAHMNAIFNYNGPAVTAMEPFFPHPGQDGKRIGRMVERSLEHYNFGDEIILAWARPDDGRDTDSPAEAE